jgi:hypothetical protein
MHDREFPESRSVELAAELLDVTSRAELEGFLGRVVVATARGLGHGAGGHHVGLGRRGRRRRSPPVRPWARI